jgi:hypothetical protein
MWLDSYSQVIQLTRINIVGVSEPFEVHVEPLKESPAPQMISVTKLYDLSKSITGSWRPRKV